MAVAVGVHLQDVDIVGEPIEQGAGQPFGTENFGWAGPRPSCAGRLRCRLAVSRTQRELFHVGEG